MGMFSAVEVDICTIIPEEGEEVIQTGFESAHKVLIRNFTS